MKMDLCDVRNIEFLDLTGVDENEQRRVRTSLQQNDPSVQLPWVKIEKNVFQEESTHGMKDHPSINSPESSTTSYKDYNHHPMMTPPILNNVFVNQNHYSQPPVAIPHILPTCVAPANVVYYANSMPPISPPYPQPVFIQGPTKVAMIPNTIPSYSQTAPYVQSPQAYQVPTNSTNSQNGVPSVPPTVTNIVTSASTIKSNLPSNQTRSHPITNNSLNDNTAHTQSALIKSSGNTPIVENGLKPTASPSLANKSWASLFSSKADGDETRSGTDAVDKAVYEQEGNKESNNNVPMCPIKNPRKSQFVDPDCYRMGEYLASYIVDGKAISLQPRGLLNQSNYCYVNSILQAIIACPPLYNLLCGLAQNISSNEKRKPTPVIDGMCRFVKEFKHLPANMRVSNRRSEGGKTTKKDQGVLINTDIPFEPSWIYKMLNGIKTDLIEGRQEDAEEFLGCLLNGLNDEMLELIKLVKNSCDETQNPQNNESELDKDWQVMGPKNKGTFSRRTEFGRTPISDIFGGFLKSRIHRAGDQITENIQPFFTLQLNIEKVNTVREALEALVTKYQLEGLTSSKTNEEVEAWQQVVLDSLPVILILHLKCFDYKMDGCTKIVKALEFPIDLKIDSKLLSSKISNPKEKQYKLFAVVYHDGEEASKGHYVTDAFHVGYSSWLRYDDASVKSVQEDNVLKPQGTRVPYLLFYRRSDTIKSK